MAKIFGAFVQQGVVIPNQGQWRVESKTVAVAGTPEQLLSIPVPDSVEVAIRAKTTNGSKRVFLANSAANAADSTKRLELKGGEQVSLFITNTNLVWIDAEVTGHGIDIVVEA